ncbi:MAG: TetR/AcrR family transcriptional regulator [Paracoccaceae bacterium]
MARKRKVDHDGAIAGALDLFWRKGYDGASTRDIEEETGLTRFTLQTAYGGKERFFLETLDAYLDNAEEKHFPNPDTFSISDLADWFQSIASAQKMPKVEDAGCLAFNSIAQFDRADAEINQRIERYLHSLEARFRDIITNESKQGKIAPPLDSAAAAQLLVTLLLGLHSIIKARTSDDSVRSYAASASALMQSWQVCH